VGSKPTALPSITKKLSHFIIEDVPLPEVNHGLRTHSIEMIDNITPVVENRLWFLSRRDEVVVRRQPLIKCKQHMRTLACKLGRQKS
jgi:hypothetical protein